VKRQRQLITGDQARIGKRQHTSPCSDCPFDRTALKGWLGETSPELWAQIVHGEGRIDCHTITPMQCAGAAIFRANVLKQLRDPDAFRLPPNKARCFSSTKEFIAHHRGGKSKSWTE
jgi:hypothetical protein